MSKSTVPKLMSVPNAVPTAPSKATSPATAKKTVTAKIKPPSKGVKSTGDPMADKISKQSRGFDMTTDFGMKQPGSKSTIRKALNPGNPAPGMGGRSAAGGMGGGMGSSTGIPNL